MIIVRIWGGLGNQLFQYALCRRLLLEGKDVRIDLETYRMKTKEYVRPYRLDLITKCQFAECTNKQRRKYSNNGKFLSSRILRTLKINKRAQIIEKNIAVYDANILMQDNKYLQGYWQTEKYFKPITDIIRQEIIFPKLEERKAVKVLECIKKANSVCVHIRRGDYLNLSKQYGSIRIGQYYKEAIRYMNEKIHNTSYFFFSDDINWVKENMYEKEACYVESNMDKEYIDLYLMSKCRHHIIANSSFSWWAAWLGKHNEQVVIAPKVWDCLNATTDIWCEDWIRM